jgi:hypothetical protein
LPIVRICTVCGSLNPGARAACRSCGASLVDAEPVDADSLPPHVREAGRLDPTAPGVDAASAPVLTVAPSAQTAQRVVITGLDIPFRDLVRLLVKLAIAAIPAIVILVSIVFIVLSFLALSGILGA